MNAIINSASGGGGAYNYILIRDEKTQNTSGGTFTSGAWRTRDLNTEVEDTGGHASVASNQITLAAGTYRVRIACPAYGVDRHVARLYNITDGAVVPSMTGQDYAASAAGGYNTGYAVIVGRFTLAAPKTLEVQHQCQTTSATLGFGVACNFGAEIYTTVELWREP